MVICTQQSFSQAATSLPYNKCSPIKTEWDRCQHAILFHMLLHDLNTNKGIQWVMCRMTWSSLHLVKPSPLLLTCFLRNNHWKPLWFSPPTPQTWDLILNFVSIYEKLQDTPIHTLRSSFMTLTLGHCLAKLGSKQPGVFPFQAPGVNNRYESSRIGF